MPEQDIEKLKEWMYRSSEQLSYLTKKVDTIDEKVDKLNSDMVILKTKAWLFGIIGGAVISALFYVALTLLK